MNRSTSLTTVLLPLLAAACASTSTFPADGGPLRAARDTPAQFVTADGAAGVASGCTNPLFDPRDRTRLRLVRSGDVGGSHRGDYSVESGRYGIGTGELLRIDCTTGQPLGIVPN